MTTVFSFLRDSPQRRRALRARVGSPERYLLYGIDELRARGLGVRHSLETTRPRPVALAAGRVAKAVVELAGGYGGDFATVLASLRAANRCDVVLSTVDTVGIPVILAKRSALVRPPLVYVAIGLPERLALLRGAHQRRLYASALATCEVIVAYSVYEASELDRWLRAHGHRARVEFVPFGVDTQAFVPGRVQADLDVVSVGADPHRDFELLLRVARTLPSVAFRLVVSAEHARALPDLPPNVEVEVDLPFEAMRDRLERARCVALPVRENSYSGATTVLLQSMALAKPLVVTRTRAIASGYGLVDGENCRLVPPGDERSFARALTGLLTDAAHARSLGAHARATVENGLDWSRYVDRIEALIRGAASGCGDRRS